MLSKLSKFILPILLIFFQVSCASKSQQLKDKYDRLVSNGVKFQAIRIKGNNNSWIGLKSTLIKYISHEENLREINQKSIEEMWKPKKKQRYLDLRNHFSGGSIKLQIKRNTIGAANTKYFTFIIKDKNDLKEIFRKKLDSSVPMVPSCAKCPWINFAFLPLKKIEFPFYVYLVDELGYRNNKIFKWKVDHLKIENLKIN